MKLKAKIGAYSSVVGGGVLLIGEKGNMVGQVSFLCHDDTLRDKAVQMELSVVIANAINDDPAARIRQLRAERGALTAELARVTALLNEALIKVENDATLWTPEWQIWSVDTRAALAAIGGAQ